VAADVAAAFEPAQEEEEFFHRFFADLPRFAVDLYSESFFQLCPLIGIFGFLQHQV